MTFRAILLAATCAVAVSSPAADFSQARKAVDQAVQAFRHFDRDQDGTPEIDKLDKIAEARSKGESTVLVLVESRLLQPGKGLPDLHPALKTLASDLAKEGRNAFVVETSCYEGPEHQDGLTLIAYRDFLRAIWLKDKGFEGVLLVGDFPQPFMVRQYAWKRDDPVTLFAGTKAEQTFKQPWVRAVAEPVVSPADIVLADMDGRWDRIYVKQPMNVTDLMAVFPAGSDVTENWEERTERYEDFFFVQDGPWNELAMGGHKMRITFEGEKNEECTEVDRRLPNPLCLPEIGVSRINARHAGLIPDPKVKGVNGDGLLDSAGNPQPVEFADPAQVPDPGRIWVRSEAFERRLLVEYFARNHAYRSAKTPDATGVGAVSTGLGQDVDELKASVKGWAGLKPTPETFLDNPITLTDVAKWMKRPLLAREIRAHSNPVLSEFGAPPDAAAMQAEIGPKTYGWIKQGNKLVPSMKGIGGAMGFGFLRDIYENKTMPASPVFYLHTGCEAMRPVGAENLPFYSDGYAAWQLAECFLMFGNGLALVGRGKVFYDEPREFWKTLGAGGTYGDAWKRYFQVEAGDAELAKDGIGRKRTYFWSMLGDFTLRLPKELVGPKAADK